MSSDDLIRELTTLNQIADTLNGAADVRTLLNEALAHLLELMGLETGWIFLKQPDAQDAWHGRGYALAAHHGLPPAMNLDCVEAWGDGCDCQSLCNANRLTDAYNAVHCSRLASVDGDRHGLSVHASALLRCCDTVLGILNVAASDWSAFSPTSLALLSSAGAMMGIALQRAQLFDLLKERRINEQAALLDFSSQLLGHIDLDILARYITTEIQRLIGADACALLVRGDVADQLVFQAATGWLADPVTARHTVPAGFSTRPGRVLTTGQPIMAADLEQVEGYGALPDWLRAEGFHGHALIPLVSGTRSVGALMIDMRQPRLLDEDEIRFLRLLGNQAALAIDKARLHVDALRAQRFEEELALARKIQLSLLPTEVPSVPGWEFAAVYQSAREVGGDFYDFVHFVPGSNNPLALVIGDVADKGMAAALYMASARTIIRTTACSELSPASVLTRSNEMLRQDSRAATFLTAFYSVLDTQTGRLDYANAGHTRPLWLQAATGELRDLEIAGIVLGAFDTIQIYEGAIEIQPGDLLVLYTDGLTDALNERREFFSAERLRQVLRTHKCAGATEIAQALSDELRDFTGNTAQFDDVTFVVIKRSPI